MKFFLFILFSLIFAEVSYSQYFPKQNDKINFSTICFEFPYQSDVESYELKIFKEDNSKPKSYTTEANKIIVADLEFGTSYFWKVIGLTRNKQVFESPIHRFTIDSILNKADLRFVKSQYNKNAASKDLLIYDYAGMVLNHNLETQWFIPENSNGVPVSKGMRDLKLTVDGTFLALIDSMAYEFDLQGNILWKAPNTGEISKRETEDYHHDIQKLPNGNYIVLGNEKVQMKIENTPVTYESGFIVEYTKEGKVVWLWRAKDFFTEELLSLHRKEDGKVNPATHMNSFHLDGKFIYVGFRDASWILKIDRASREVVEIYGGQDSGLPNHFAKHLFRFQHDSEVLPNQNAMAIINNDSIADPSVTSSFLIFSLGDLTHDKGELLYKFSFKFDNKTNGKSQKMGNVTPLKNGNFLINMGSLNRVIEITQEGQVVWDVFTEKRDSTKVFWHPFSTYRVSTASSLYPNVFSVKPEIKFLNKSLYADLTITNVGSEAHHYEIYSLNKKNERTLISNTPHFIKSNEMKLIEIESNDKNITALEIVVKGTCVKEVIPIRN